MKKRHKHFYIGNRGFLRLGIGNFRLELSIEKGDFFIFYIQIGWFYIYGGKSLWIGRNKPK